MAKSSDEALLADNFTLPTLPSGDDLDADAYGRDYTAGAEMTNEDARSLWEAITLNLAFLLSKIKFENADQMTEAASWLEEQLEAGGGR